MVGSWKTSVVALAGLLTLAPVASARQVVIVRPYYRPYYHRFYGPGFYGPGWYNPWWGPAYVPAERTGNVKIETNLKGASIFVDGGYAGLTGKLKTFSLRPGNHDIELRDPSGHTFFQERVHVILGKTTKIHADHLG